MYFTRKFPDLVMNLLVFMKTEESKPDPVSSIMCLAGGSERKMKAAPCRTQPAPTGPPQGMAQALSPADSIAVKTYLRRGKNITQVGRSGENTGEKQP